ncbi:antitoxin family protein [Limnoraphis robusta]|uniref:Antitoxin family protein n=1 Tax=Limnoraphis robusta CCNP1315 TaxID=3110306 RepID=A0ABU5TSN1_9CYAN|nr:antitoxin family protein [Limnoraphis robusta]MEA5517578.1 antitoxin family protein [Limnoraphis robusta CCNP1315]MEA5544620.1 antitoxin family protein [Limnoraphis robusta CCNP1324]
MTYTLQAIYEQGMLRLMQPVDLPEGTSVKVIITANDSTQEEKNPADILAQIAALPLESEPENISGRDHDRILYPHQK